MVTPTRPRPSAEKRLRKFNNNKDMTYTDWYWYTQLSAQERNKSPSERLRDANKKFMYSNETKRDKNYPNDHKDASGANLAKDVFVYDGDDGDDGVVAFYYCPMVPLNMHDIKNKSLKDYEDPAGDNYDPFVLSKNVWALEEPNGSQII